MTMKIGIKRIDLKFIFVTRIHWELNDHALYLQIMRCCLIKYIIVLNPEKDAIDIEGEDEIKRNRLFFDFMLRMFYHLNQLYEKEKNLLIDTIIKYHLRKESAKENTSKPSPSSKESVEENSSKPSPSRKDSAKKNT